ncbi:hypothetical protein [Alteromonas oceanisediminis]|uniref:hypothetical protein n=1 Tax=Alteromonas oceanisediminis TaxID=2836180 RepID=UPI001BD9F126|nr:hypothetical protein [Alteromonas oceanisediminis]MBT0586673.1 hypothetical protein [Alteromonas oceanisediminis]
MANWRGKVRIFVHDNIVFDIPSRLFTEKEIEQCRARVLEAAEPLNKWVLLSIPDESVGLTPPALANLEDCYKRFFSHGCKGILILTQTASAKIIKHHMQQAKLDNCVCHNSIETLIQQAEDWLDMPGILTE